MTTITIYKDNMLLGAFNIESRITDPVVGEILKVSTISGPQSPPGPGIAPLLLPTDPNMFQGESKGTQSVSVGKERYYKFVLPAHCNKLTVNWTTFDWVGQMDMLVKAGSLPTIADWNNAVASGYPARASGPVLWYNLMQTSGDGGETVTMTSVPAGTYYIMLKNTRSAADSQFKVWYTPNCSYSGR